MLTEKTPLSAVDVPMPIIRLSKVNVSNLSNGPNIVRITTANGVKNQRFVKEQSDYSFNIMMEIKSF